MNGSPWPRETIESLISSGAIVGHKDGNYGSLYPKIEEFGRVGVPFLTAKSIVGGTLDINGAPRLADDRANALRFGFVRPGDVLLSHNATIGRVATVPQSDGRLLIGTSLTYFRLNPERLSARYLAAYLASEDFQNQLIGVMSHSTRNQVPISVQRKLSVVVPPLPTQNAIANIIGALDDRIEQNRRTTQALEQLARAIFRAWFVDFEPVKAKAAGATVFPSMPQAVFDALPTRFVDSAIGPVPEGWKVKALAGIATFLNGLALQKYAPRNDGEDLRVIKIAELRKGSTDGADLANSDVPAEYVIDDRDLLFSWSGTLEAELWLGGKGALNQHLFKVSSPQFPSWFCLLWIHQHLPWFRAIAASKATTMGHIKRGHLQEAKVVVPPAPVVGQTDQVVGSLYDLHAQLMIESRELAAMREYLLPKLLTGEVRIRSTALEEAK